jgi:hypothetical protein
MLATVNVVSAVDQPVHIEHHGSIGTQLTGATTDFLMPGNGRFTAAMVFAGSSDKYIEGTWQIFAARTTSPMMILLKLLLCV